MASSVEHDGRRLGLEPVLEFRDEVLDQLGEERPGVKGWEGDQLRKFTREENSNRSVAAAMAGRFGAEVATSRASDTT